MRIMLAGGAGYIGSVLSKHLSERGYSVESVDLCWFKPQAGDLSDVRKKELFDITEEDCSGFDQIVFLAGLSNDPMAEISPSLNFIYNAALPAYLAYVGKRAGVKRFIYASSCSVYGYSANEAFDENGPAVCGYPYGISKLQGERGVLYFADDDFSVIALRQGTVGGYSPRMRFDLVVNAMYRTAITEGVINVDNPSIWRPLLDVRDAAQGFTRAIQAPQEVGGIFNIAVGNYLVGQIGDIVKDTVEELTGREIKLNINNRQDYRNYKVEAGKAREVIGFMPRFDVADMVRSIHRHHDELIPMDRADFFNARVFSKMRFDIKQRS